MVEALIARGFSQRKACYGAGLWRSTWHYQTQKGPEGQDEELGNEILGLAQRYKRYGYRRVWALLRRDSKKRWGNVNHKRVHRIWKTKGLQVPRKRPKRRRSGTAAMRLPHRATHRNHVWTYDFAYDRTEGGRLLKFLAVVDEWTRECLRIRVGYSMGSEEVLEVLQWLFEEVGAPEFIRSDNGGEFIAQQVQAWLAAKKAKTIYITPGHPWENPFAESFIGKFRDECLNEELFRDDQEAQVIVESWRQEYNQFRPHSSLGYKTPAEAALSSVGTASSSDKAGRTRGERMRYGG